MIDEISTPIYRVKTAFLNSIYATIGSIVLGFGFKIWRDVSGGNDSEDKPQKIEITIKDVSDDENRP